MAKTNQLPSIEELAQKIVAIVLGADAKRSTKERTEDVVKILNRYYIYQS